MASKKINKENEKQVIIITKVFSEMTDNIYMRQINKKEKN
jgi:hypothetical protein